MFRTDIPNLLYIQHLSTSILPQPARYRSGVNRSYQLQQPENNTEYSRYGYQGNGCGNSLAKICIKPVAALKQKHAQVLDSLQGCSATEQNCGKC